MSGYSSLLDIARSTYQNCFRDCEHSSIGEENKRHGSQQFGLDNNYRVDHKAKKFRGNAAT